MHKLQDLNILLVDDQLDVRALLREMMLEMGITQIFDAEDGQEALNFLEAADDFIDIVICDWNMPEITGVELLQQLRHADITIPFLMVTGRGDPDSVIRAKDSGVSAYIHKPFCPSQLETKLRILQAQSQVSA